MTLYGSTLTDELEGMTDEEFEAAIVAPQSIMDAPVRQQPQLPAAQPIQSGLALPPIDFGQLLRGPWGWIRENYPLLFWAFAFLSITGLTLLTVKNAQQGNQAATLPTAMSQQVQQQTLEQSINIVLGRPVPDGQGRARPAVAMEIFEASKRVMQFEEEQLLQTKVNELDVAIKIGMGTPDHLCYRLSRGNCINVLEAGVDRRRQEAQATRNTDEMLITDDLYKAFDRLRQGSVQVASHDPDLYKMARVAFLSALQSLEASSPNGQAAATLQLLEQQRNAGLMYNPATGQMEQVQQQ